MWREIRGLEGRGESLADVGAVGSGGAKAGNDGLCLLGAVRECAAVLTDGRNLGVEQVVVLAVEKMMCFSHQNAPVSCY